MGYNLHSHLTRQMVLPLPAGEGRGLLDLGKVQKEFAGGKGPLWAERAGARESLGKGSVPLHMTVAYPTDLAVLGVYPVLWRFGHLPPMILQFPS
jgi:hypothetical protein